MIRFVSRLSKVQGIIDRRILANYRLDPDLTARQLPAPFRPKLVNGYAIGGLCLIRLRKVRPSLMPLPVGIRSENAAHRIAVVWDDKGVEREGVYIPRRDTDSRLNVLAGGRLFPGIHHHADFQVAESEDLFDVGFNSVDGSCSMNIAASRSTTFPADSVFSSLDDASRFFESGSLGYSATEQSDRFDGLELDCVQWEMAPLKINEIHSSYFDDPNRFPAGSTSVDCALLMTGIDHAWHQRGVMCCPQSVKEIVDG